MPDEEEVPDSWIMAHRVVPGHFDRCLDILMEASADDPFIQWIGEDRRTRLKFFQYILTWGFRDGRVMLAQPRAGVCVTTPPERSWSLKIFWARLRLRLALSAKRKRGLDKIEDQVRKNADPGSIFIWYIGVRQPFRKRGVMDKLLQQAVPADSDEHAFVYATRPEFASVLKQRGGAEIVRADIPGGSSSLRLYQIEAAKLRDRFHS